MTERELERRRAERHRQALAAMEAAKQRNDKALRRAPRVAVTHPKYGWAAVRGGSNCEAVHEAAGLWGVPYAALSAEAEVWQLACHLERLGLQETETALKVDRKGLAELVREVLREGPLPDAQAVFRQNPNHSSWTVLWPGPAGIRYRARLVDRPGAPELLFWRGTALGWGEPEFHQVEEETLEKCGMRGKGRHGPG